ncbi:MAG: amidohydrolase family protein [Desulfobacteraceae bacterium]|jgi:imidazolonepropionase-like amidohydrolase|nr:amidohydrolase family protein [Desulfobacteraceae bacterium]
MPTVLKAAAVLDMDNGQVIADGYVLVDGEKIESWGHRVDLPPLPPDTAVLSFPQQTLLPGLINSHAHLCLPSGGQPFYLEQSNEMALLTAVRNIRLEQSAGITTVRDCGDQNGVLLALRQAINRGILDGPRLLLCGPPLTMSGGHAHFLGGVADGPAEIARTVRRRVADGADFIKLIGTGGGTPGTQPDQASYTRDELAAAVAEAHRLDVPVTVHCRGIPGIANAIEAGVDQIEHACFELPDGTLSFDRKLADRMAQAGIGVTPTIQLYRDAHAHLQKKAATGELDETERQYLKILPGVIESKRQALRGFLEAGVNVVAGNDAGLPYTGFGCLWQELDVMMSGGMNAVQAIAAATVSAARMLGLEDQIGSIQPGKQADLLVVDGNPIEDMAALSRVRLVMQAGRIVFNKIEHQTSKIERPTSTNDFCQF